MGKSAKIVNQTVSNVVPPEFESYRRHFSMPTIFIVECGDWLLAFYPE